MGDIRFPKVVIALPWYSEHDAISNDAYWQKKYLSERGVDCYLYAEGYADKLRSQLISFDECQRLLKDPSNLLIYHHGVYWVQGEQIFNSTEAKICLKYHNITPPEFYRNYDSISTYATEMGRQQTGRFLQSQKIWLCTAASHYNIRDLESYGCPLPRTDVVAPFTQISDFDFVEADPSIVRSIRANGRRNLLFVGRVVPNKGHMHLLKVLERYMCFYGSAVHLNIIGGMSLGEDRYFIELEHLIESLCLSKNVTFHQKVGLSGLKAFYQNSDAFLLMSEHEGFCVPILESQHLGLPLIALDRAAVKETLGSGQLVMQDLDYDFFACAVHHVVTNKELKADLCQNGFSNCDRFRPEVLLQKTIACLSAA